MNNFITWQCRSDFFSTSFRANIDKENCCKQRKIIFKKGLYLFLTLNYRNYFANLLQSLDHFAGFLILFSGGELSMMLRAQDEEKKDYEEKTDEL